MESRCRDLDQTQRNGGSAWNQQELRLVSISSHSYKKTMRFHGFDLPAGTFSNVETPKNVSLSVPLLVLFDLLHRRRLHRLRRPRPVRLQTCPRLCQRQHYSIPSTSRATFRFSLHKRRSPSCSDDKAGNMGRVTCYSQHKLLFSLANA